MYEKFLELSLNAEKELNSLYYSQNSTVMDKQHSRLQPPMAFQRINLCDIKKPVPIFCSRGQICDELIKKNRSGNGNNQKMFLYSSKNKDYIPTDTFYWVDYEN